MAKPNLLKQSLTMLLIASSLLLGLSVTQGVVMGADSCSGCGSGCNNFSCCPSPCRYWADDSSSLARGLQAVLEAHDSFCESFNSFCELFD